jgi:transposase
MNAELWAEIRRLFNIDKISMREIARRFAMDRKTVRKAVRSDTCPVVRRTVQRPSKLDPFKSYIAERLEQYPRLPGTTLFLELKKQGYTGRIHILTQYLKSIREKAKEAYLRIETQPGEEMQVDWAYCGSVRIGHAVRRLSAFLAVLSYSRMMFVKFTLSQRLEDFIQGHLEAFAYFGGVTRKILYDNLRSVVIARFGSEIKFNPRFMEFAGVYGFEPIPCNVGCGNEKGKVESGVYFLRSSFLSGRDPRWPHIQMEAEAWLNEVANVRLHRTTREKPVDRWEQEKPFLIPLPAKPYDASIVRTLPSSHQALVRFDGNKYSVPYVHAYKLLQLRATLTEVRLLLEEKEIARHHRCYDRGMVIEDPKHYEGLLASKKKAFVHHLERQFLSLGEGAKPYRDGLFEMEIYPHRHFQEILELAAAYSKEEVMEAMAHAHSCKAFGAPYIRNILLQKRAAKGLKEILPIIIPQKPAWNDLFTEEPDLSLYDKLVDPKEPFT